jgi:hypothetical protein
VAYWVLRRRGSKLLLIIGSHMAFRAGRSLPPPPPEIFLVLISVTG